MKVRLLQFQPSDPARVSFLSAHGTGQANWSGPQPALDAWLEVELDLDDAFDWGKNLMPSTHHDCQLRVQDDALHLRAELIAIEADGTGALNVGGSIVLISLAPNPEARTGWVELVARDVTLQGVAL